ncbi:MAG: ABC transporter permease subunit [Chloroflexi bacterium]|nr:ABC transporter permease subunit [Chloroflexota bacterium]
MTETFRGLWVVAYRDLLTFIGDRFRLLASLAFPLLFLAIFGGGFSEVIGRMAGGVGLLQFMYPGIIAQMVLTTSLFGGVSVVTDRETGFLREILVAPISRAGIVLGKVVGAAVVALLQVLALLGLAPIVGVPLDVELVVRLLPVVVLLSVALSGLGILIASFAPSQQGFQLLMQMLVFPMIFLAGVFFPVDRVPLWMEILSKLNPVTYGVDAVRQVFLGSGPAAAGLGVTVLGHTMTLVEEVALIGALGLVLVAAAVRSFGRQA